MHKVQFFGFLCPVNYRKLIENQFQIWHFYKININSELKHFWKLEEAFNSDDKTFSPEKQFVGSHFQENYSINSDGRFTVKLPFYKSKFELGNSKSAAFSTLHAMERKLKKNSEFEEQYKDFMHEYVNLGHMQLVTQNSLSIYQNEQYFLLHHAVVKPSRTTTKLRVVFDSSCKTLTGKSSWVLVLSYKGTFLKFYSIFHFQK